MQVGLPGRSGTGDDVVGAAEGRDVRRLVDAFEVEVVADRVSAEVWTPIRTWERSACEPGDELSGAKGKVGYTSDLVA